MGTFAERLKELRNKKGISQDKLAEEVGTTRSAIGNYEQGTREPDFEMLEKLADYFNCNMDYLTGKNTISIDITDLSEDNQKRMIMYYAKLIELQHMEEGD